jgi:hypothetical protein
MGMNTVVLIHNNELDTIEDNAAQAWDGVARGIHTSQRTGRSSNVSITSQRGNHSNVMSVMPPIHSTDSAIYLISGNSIWEITAGNLQRDRRIRENLLKVLKEMHFLPESYKPPWL